MKKLLSLLLCCGLLLMGCSANDGQENTEITVGGSTSVQPLMEEIAEAFYEDGLGMITVQGGGSSVGAKGATDGTFDVGMLSRDLKEEEKENLEGIVIALDGIVIIVNKENEISDITLEQAKKIYTGEITNWKELGGSDGEIAVVSREEGSGTRDGFESIVGFDSEELVSDAEIQNATGAVVSSINGNKNAIGYISLGSLSEDVKVLNVAGVEASTDSIKNGSYTLQRPFVLAVQKENENSQALFDYIFSNEGKAIIEENKYIAVEK